MHGCRYASKYIPQGETVAQVKTKAHLIVQMFGWTKSEQSPCFQYRGEYSQHFFPGEGSRAGRVFVTFVA